MELPARTLRSLQNSRILPVVVLAAIIAAHLVSVLSLHPSSLFGLSQDDTLYFTSAKALAEGRGYILPSLPGAPAATKYPILYPWLLSFVWRVSPNFPGNLSPAIALTYLFAVAAILLGYFFCRLPLHLPRLESLAITALFALHPTFIFYSARLMTDVPFAALALAFLLFAWRASETESGPIWPVLAGLFASLCILMRLAGVAFVAGMLGVLVLRKLWKTAAAFLLSCAPGLSYFLYQSWFRAASPPPVPFSHDLPGWTQTWHYYTSYTAFRRLDSPDLHSALTLLLNQILYLVSAIAGYFVRPLADANIGLWFFCSLVLSTLLAVACARSFAHRPLSAAIAVFLAYVLLLLGWDYVEWGRFLLPFLPLMAALISSQGYRCCQLLRSSGKDWLSRALYACILACAAGLALATLWNFAVSDRRWLAEVKSQRESALREKREAYEWIGAHTALDDTIIASEDGLAYLYTGRRSINFTVLMPYDVYERVRLNWDLAHMPDVALALDARYWLITSQDSETQLTAFEPGLRRQLAAWQDALPRVFRSSGGNVVLCDLKCLRTRDLHECSSEARELLSLRAGVGRSRN